MDGRVEPVVRLEHVVWLGVGAAAGTAAVAISGLAQHVVGTEHATQALDLSANREFGRCSRAERPPDSQPLTKLQEHINPRLVEDALEAYVDWREEFAWVRASDDRWTGSNGAEAGFAFISYRAAVERKRAAHVYAECIVRVAQRARQWG